MNNHNKLEVDKFLSSISPWSSAYSEATFSYIAVKRNDLPILLYGRLFLIPKLALKILPQRFETKNILANTFLISDLGITFQEFIVQILEKKRVKVPDGELLFPVAEDGDLSAYFNGFHMDGITFGKRVSYLRLSGESRHTLFRQPDIDWELKGAIPTFDSIVDLMTEHSLLGCDTSDAANIEIISNTIVEIDINSKVVADTAEPAILLANSLDKSMCAIGYRVFFNGKVHARGSISSNNIVWRAGDDVQHGVGTLRIPVGASIHCVANYDGHAQHQYWIADLNNLPNSRRVLLEECDPDLSVFRDYLFNEKKPRKESRDFEIGVTLLMWMLGYSASQPGGSPRLSDSIDIIATTSKGNILLIECTTGLLKTENKLAKLIARTETIKRRMQDGHRHLIILPMIVTAMTREEVRSEIEGAIELGIVVITKDELTEMLNQTIAVIDSDVHFNQLRRTQPKQQSQD